MSNDINWVYGIDLGTTNSAISIFDGKMETLVIDGKETVPSCVRWLGGDNFEVGKSAYFVRYQDDVAYSTKRLMGSSEVVPLVAETGEKRDFLPREIAAKLLRGMVDKAQEQTLHKNIHDVVITVPAYFNNNQITDTLLAGKDAGLNVLEVMKEPTAAALQYNREITADKTIMVYDLGGGTFDVSVVRISKIANDNLSEADEFDFYSFEEDEETLNEPQGDKTLFSVLKVIGDPKLGGDDVDNIITDLLIERLIEKYRGNTEYPIDMKNSTLASKPVRELIKCRAEEIKKVFDTTSISAQLPLRINGRKYVVNVTRDDFDKAFTEIFNRTDVLMSKIIEMGSDDPDLIDYSSIDQIILVGGTTKSVKIRELLGKRFPGSKVNDSLNPDLSVAQGAAIQAKRIAHGGDDLKVLDVLPMSIGLSTEDGTMNIMLQEGTNIPASKTLVFEKGVGHANTVTLQVYQGNEPLAKFNGLLGEYTLACDNASEFVSVRFSIDTNNTLTVGVVGADGTIETVELERMSTTLQAQNITPEERFCATVEQKIYGCTDEDAVAEMNGIIQDLSDGSISLSRAKNLFSRVRISKVEELNVFGGTE